MNSTTLIPMAKSKAQQALEFVREEAKHSPSDADLHNAFFGNGGKFGQLFPTRQEREGFAKTPEYEEIVRIRVPGRSKKAVARVAFPNAGRGA
jgi:hypothetical protein